MGHPFNFASRLVTICVGIIALSACNRPATYPPGLAVADSLASADPDSAVALLTAWDEEMKNSPEHIHNYYQLLCIKARDKAHITHTSDSIIKSLVRYYESDGDQRRLPEVYYYAGRVHDDMGDTPQAVEYFNKVLDTASDEESFPFKSRAYSQLGRIFEHQYLPQLALEMSRKTYNCDIQLGDNGSIVSDLENIANAHWKCHHSDSAEFYFKAAISSAEARNDTLQTYLIKGELGHLYIDLGRYDEVEELIRPYLHRHLPGDKYNIYSITAKYFLATEQWDSAQFYYEKSFSGSDIYTKRNAYWGFAQIAFVHNDLEMGKHYLAQYDLCLDSILKITTTKIIGQIHFGYNYELHEKESSYLKEESTRRQKYIILLFATLGIILGGAISYTIYRRRKQRKIIPINNKNNSIAGPYTATTRQTGEQTATPTIEKSTEKPPFAFPAPEPEQTDRHPHPGTENGSGTPLSPLQNPALPLELSELHLYLLNKVDKENPLADHDWINIENTIRKNFPEFLSRLCEAHPCSIIELRVSMLVKLNIPPVYIAAFVDRSKEAVSSIRRRLYEKTFGEKGNAKKWDTFIQSL